MEAGAAGVVVNGESPATAGTAALAPTTTPVVGVLEVLPDGNAFLRSASRNYLAHPLDPFVSQNIIRQCRLKEGMEIAGTARLGGDRKARFGLMSVETINNLAPDDFNARKPYADLVSIDPTSRIRLECGHESLSMRVVDLIAPIGKGQRCLIVAPPKAGKTVLLQKIAHVDHGEPPRDPPDRPPRRRAPRGGHRHAPQRARRGASPRRRTSWPATTSQVAEIALERAKRLVEAGRDVDGPARFDHAPVARLQHRAEGLAASALRRDRRADDGEAAPLLRRRAERRARRVAHGDRHGARRHRARAWTR